MRRYHRTILARGTGMALQDALVTIYLTGTTDKATVYTENDTASDELDNPLTTDSYGAIEGYLPDGVYDFRVDHGSYPSYTIEEEQVYDLSELDTAVSGPMVSITGSANQIAYFSGPDMVQVIDFTQMARDLLDDTDEPTMRNTLGIQECMVIPLSDEATDLGATVGVFSFRMPYNFELLDIRASVRTAPVGDVVQVDMNVAGVSALSTKLTIDAGETSSVDAAVPPVISDATIAEDALVSFDIDTVGVATKGNGLKVTLIGRQTD